MRVTPILTLPVLLLSLSTSVLADSSARTVQEIVTDANRLLGEGSYSQAARAYSEAIGARFLPSALTVCGFDSRDQISILRAM